MGGKNTKNAKSPRPPKSPRYKKDTKNNKDLTTTNPLVLNAGHPLVDGLPEEILLEILNHLPVPQLFKFTLVCRKLAYSLEKRWKKLFENTLFVTVYVPKCLVDVPPLEQPIHCSLNCQKYFISSTPRTVLFFLTVPEKSLYLTSPFGTRLLISALTENSNPQRMKIISGDSIEARIALPYPSLESLTPQFTIMSDTKVQETNRNIHYLWQTLDDADMVNMVYCIYRHPHPNLSAFKGIYSHLDDWAVLKENDDEEIHISDFYENIKTERDVARVIHSIASCLSFLQRHGMDLSFDFSSIYFKKQSTPLNAIIAESYILQLRLAFSSVNLITHIFKQQTHELKGNDFYHKSPTYPLGILCHCLLLGVPPSSNLPPALEYPSRNAYGFIETLVNGRGGDTFDSVLEHPWVKEDTDGAVLDTPIHPSSYERWKCYWTELKSKSSHPYSSLPFL